MPGVFFFFFCPHGMIPPVHDVLLVIWLLHLWASRHGFAAGHKNLRVSCFHPSRALGESNSGFRGPLIGPSPLATIHPPWYFAHTHTHSHGKQGGQGPGGGGRRKGAHIFMAGLRRRVGFDIIIIIPEESITFAARDLFCGHEGIRWSSGNGGMVSHRKRPSREGGGFFVLFWQWTST